MKLDKISQGMFTIKKCVTRNHDCKTRCPFFVYLRIDDICF